MLDRFPLVVIMEKLLFTILFIVYEVNSQKCGPGIFLGPLPYERFNVPIDVPIGPQPCQSPVPCQTCQSAQPGPINLPPLSFNIGPIVPQCQQPKPPCQQLKPPCQQPKPPCQQNVPQVPINIPIQPPSGPIAPPCLPITPPSLPITPPCRQTQPPFIPNLPCNPPTPNLPSVGTIIDNTLANSLANAIQLLIVSNLIENTANYATNIPNNYNYDSPNCLTNVFDLTSPDYYYDPYESVLEIPCAQEQPCIQNPCVEIPTNFPIAVQIPVSDCSCGNFGNLGDFTYNFGNGNTNFANFNGNLGNLNGNVANLITENGILSNIVTGNGNFGNFGIGNGNFGNLFTGNSNSGVPIICDGGIGTLAPVVAEVPIPAEIPAQLVCNFGYMPANVPCVSVNVETLPFNNGFC